MEQKAMSSRKNSKNSCEPTIFSTPVSLKSSSLPKKNNLSEAKSTKLKQLSGEKTVQFNKNILIIFCFERKL